MSHREGVADTKPETKRELKPKLRFPEFREKGEWFQKLGSDVFEQINNKKHNSNLPVLAITQEHGAIPRDAIDYQVSVTQKSIESYKVVEAGDFIISLRSFQGGIEYSSYKGICSPAYVILRKRASAFEPYFKQFFKTEKFIQTLNKNVEGLRDGKMVSYKQFSELLLPIPSNDEQQKIADRLSSLDELIAAQSQKLEHLQAHKKGLMRQLFPAEGETVPKLRFPEFQGGLEWEEDTLVKVAKFRRGSFPQPYGLPEWYDEGNGTPFVQVFDVSNDLRLKAKTKNKISKIGAEQSVFIPKGALIVTLQGSIGRVAITQYDAYVDRTLLIFESFLKPTEKLFFAYVIQNLFEIERAKAPGGIIKTITKEALSDFNVKLPTLPEQQKIAACLSSLDEVIDAQKQKIESLKVHKKGLMQQLFPSPDEVRG